jgi:hypothetical protein
MKLYSDAAKLSDLRRLLLRMPVQEFLDWNGPPKPGTFLELVDLLEREAVDTEADLRPWLSAPDSREKLLAVRFIGPKTVDYLKILVDLPVAATVNTLFIKPRT